MTDETPQTRTLQIGPRRSNFGGRVRRCALPVAAALVAALALSVWWAGAAHAQFRGYDLRAMDSLPSSWHCGNLQDLRAVHRDIELTKQYGTTERSAQLGPFAGYVVWGHTQENGWTRLYFVPTNLNQVC